MDVLDQTLSTNLLFLLPPLAPLLTMTNIEGVLSRPDDFLEDFSEWLMVVCAF